MLHQCLVNDFPQILWWSSHLLQGPEDFSGGPAPALAQRAQRAQPPNSCRWHRRWSPRYACENPPNSSRLMMVWWCLFFRHSSMFIYVDLCLSNVYKTWFGFGWSGLESDINHSIISSWLIIIHPNSQPVCQMLTMNGAFWPRPVHRHSMAQLDGHMVTCDPKKQSLVHS